MSEMGTCVSLLAIILKYSASLFPIVGKTPVCSCNSHAGPHPPGLVSMVALEQPFLTCAPQNTGLSQMFHRCVIGIWSTAVAHGVMLHMGDDAHGGVVHVGMMCIGGVVHWGDSA